VVTSTSGKANNLYSSPVQHNDIVLKEWSLRQRAAMK
jgi:hypothetical protein